MNTESNGHLRGGPKIFNVFHVLLAFALGWACYWAIMPRPGRYVPITRGYGYSSGVLDTQTGHVYTDDGDWDAGDWPRSKSYVRIPPDPLVSNVLNRSSQPNTLTLEQANAYLTNPTAPAGNAPP